MPWRHTEGSRGRALLFLRPWYINGTGDQRHVPAVLPRCPIEVSGWAPGPVWTGTESLAPPPPGLEAQTAQSMASRYTAQLSLSRDAHTFFSFRKRPYRPWGPPSLLLNGHWGSPPTCVKQPGFETGQSPPPSAGVKNECSQWRTQEFCSGGGFNKFSWGQRA